MSTPLGPVTTRAPPVGASQARLRANSSMRGTILGFFGVLGLALPTFIYFKQKNDVKKKEQYAKTRIRTGAMGLMGSGEKVE